MATILILRYSTYPSPVSPETGDDGVHFCWFNVHWEKEHGVGGIDGYIAVKLVCYIICTTTWPRLCSLINHFVFIVKQISLFVLPPQLFWLRKIEYYQLFHSNTRKNQSSVILWIFVVVPSIFSGYVRSKRYFWVFFQRCKGESEQPVFREALCRECNRLPDTGITHSPA